ncbi:MAG TPA: hypothetical protein VFS11_01960 [Gemmatimonadales bacterium]|nr:hypothetical protein [Gemmatimonadales bacterium]
MVSSVWRNRRGAGTLGCLLTLLVLVAVLYYGINIGEVYWRYYQLLDEMQVNARLAPSLTDDVIQRRLATKAADLFGADNQLRFHLNRGGRTRYFTIEAQYRDSVSLPLFKRTFVLKPRVEEPI